MRHVPYVYVDYLRPVGVFPSVTYGWQSFSEYRAEKADNGADVTKDGRKVAWFADMNEACNYVNRLSDAI